MRHPCTPPPPRGGQQSAARSASCRRSVCSCTRSCSNKHHHIIPARPTWAPRAQAECADARGGRERAVLVCEVLLGSAPTGGLGRRPRRGSESPYPELHGLYGEDYPPALIRGSPDGTVEPIRYRQETMPSRVARGSSRHRGGKRKRKGYSERTH